MACQDDNVSANLIAEQYCNIFDNKRELLPYYLANHVVLKWFGRTISGKKDVYDFINQDLVATTHILTSVESCDSIQLCNSDPSSDTSTSKSTLPQVEFEAENFMIQERNIARMKNLAFTDNTEKQIAQLHSEGVARHDVMMMGDTALNNYCVPLTTKVEEGQGDCVPQIFICNQRFFEARGALQFCRSKQSPTSSKNLKYVSDTMKWERVCKVHVGYNLPSGPNPLNEFEICLMLYEDTIRCRRNLALEFAKLADEPF